MSIPDQFPRRVPRAVPATAAPPVGTAEESAPAAVLAAVARRSMSMARQVSRDQAAALAGLAGGLAAVSAAVWFDFFLTVPYERLTITRRADVETTVLILAVGIAVTEIAVRGRRQHAAAARRAGYLDGIGAAARVVAAGTDPQQLIGQVCDQLTRLLGLSACRFQDGAAGIGSPPRLLPDGRVDVAGQTWDTRLAGLPPGRDTELLAEAGGLLQGRFLLAPGTGRPTAEQRLVAVGLASQAAAALASTRLAGHR